MAGWPLFPQSPGSRPGAFMGAREGLPVLSSRPRKRAHVRIAILEGKAVRHTSPQRELGDCDVAHQLASQAQAVLSSGVV
jgi:hypothetical protein